jgi:quinolinate synthase
MKFDVKKENALKREQASQVFNDPSFNLEEEILNLKKEKNAVILGHYYQNSEIQELADFIGDSFELSKKAKASTSDVILFAGVKFMAETAKILNPSKKVLVPDLEAGCSLESSCPPKEFEAFRKKHPEHIAITYINCSAEIKALSDIICTSSNALTILSKLPKEQKIIFAPDKFLGGYLNKITGRDMLLWNGSCLVHERFSEMELVKLQVKHKNAHIVAHPECPESLLKYASFIGSTSALLNFTKERAGEEFIVLTESGIIHQMQKYNPNGKFYTVPYLEKDGVTCINCNDCPFMRLNTMEKIYLALKLEDTEILIPEEIRLKAEKSLNKMLELAL